MDDTERQRLVDRLVEIETTAGPFDPAARVEWQELNRLLWGDQASQSELTELRMAVGHVSALIRMGRVLLAVRDGTLPREEGLDEAIGMATEWEEARRR